LGQSFFNVGVQFAGFSSILAAINFLVTITAMRAPGMNFWRMPLLAWANLATSILIVGATPFIAGVQMMILFDRILGMNFFESAVGGDAISYQHIFWFYSHPAVYIMMLPGFGIVSEVISTNARKPLFGYSLMALSLPPTFNFEAIPRVVGGPYEYGVPGARHALMAGEEGQRKVSASKQRAAEAAASGNH
jgi:cytochrome c oxidase subunit 1